MPTNTFFSLPEAKKRRLMNVCWEEFSCHAYEDVSINQIVRRARIPRGSFYQYFTDKEDLFLYLLSRIPEEITCLFLQEWKAGAGNTAQILARVFDRLCHTAVVPTLPVWRYLQALRSNPYLDWLQIFPGFFPEEYFHTDEGRLAVGIFLTACKRALLHPENTPSP